MTDFGKHITIDASGCSWEKLTNQDMIYDLLNELPGKLGMTKMALPSVVEWLDKGAKIPGISGFVMIAESHISVHTFPEKDYVFIDVFSCMGFDVEKTVKSLVEFFEAKKHTTQVITRGIDFPRSHPHLISSQKIEVEVTK